MPSRSSLKSISRGREKKTFQHLFGAYFCDKIFMRSRNILLCRRMVMFQVIPFDTTSNFLHKRSNLLDTSVSDAELFYGTTGPHRIIKLGRKVTTGLGPSL
jgi:hypothetical protein